MSGIIYLCTDSLMSIFIPATPVKSLGVTHLSLYHFLFHPEDNSTYTFPSFFSRSNLSMIFFIQLSYKNIKC